MTTNVWLRQEWTDINFRWDPKEFGGVKVLHIPADRLWIPDIVLYNNADGNYQVTIMTKATVSFNGTILWEPPAIYRSMCQINVRWFPFDEQHCELKFGSWTYGGNEVDLVHYNSEAARYVLRGTQNVSILNSEGIDLKEFYPSVEWDIMEIPSERHELRFDYSSAPFIDITFYLNLRRKTLFYTVNLIIPSVGISLLTVTVFYLPSDSGEKVVLCISILISLTVFFLLLVDIIPSTSLVIPLIGLYLLFTMVMVTLSIAVTVITLNVHYRSTNTHSFPKWVRIVFIDWLPWILLMQRPEERPASESVGEGRTCSVPAPELPRLSSRRLADEESNVLSAAADGVCYIAENLKQRDEDDEMREDWRFIAQVLDRLFLWIFSLTCLGGTCGILLRAPIIYDMREPLA